MVAMVAYSLNHLDRTLLLKNKEATDLALQAGLSVGHVESKVNQWTTFFEHSPKQILASGFCMTLSGLQR